MKPMKTAAITGNTKLTKKQADQKLLDLRIVWMDGYNRGVQEGYRSLQVMVETMTAMMDKSLLKRVDKAVGDLIAQHNQRMDKLEAEINQAGKMTAEKFREARGEQGAPDISDKLPAKN